LFRVRVRVRRSAPARPRAGRLPHRDAEQLPRLAERRDPLQAVLERRVGAQALEFEADGAFGLRLRTVEGGSFYFGDAKWNDGSDDACYAFLKADAGRFVVPFHDLTWRAATADHVPSHPLASITFMGEARFARLAFLRPRATTLARTDFCVAGRIADFRRGETVHLGERRETVDQRGWFCFPRTARGVYRLTSEARCDRRGPLVEVGADVFNLVLDRSL